MPRNNALTERLGLAVPIVQAPMAGATTPGLAAAVCAAGGLGSLGCGTQPVEASRGQIEEARRLGARPLHVNFFCHAEPGAGAGGDATRMRALLAPFFFERGLGEPPLPALPYQSFGAEQLALVEALRPEVVSFHFGLPEAGLVEAVKAAGAMVWSSATTVAEARWLEEHGADAVIAQGAEAGGHRGTFLGAEPAHQPGTMALVPQVADAVAVPVIAAGGIADGRGVAAALLLGASAAQLGTAFLRCPEAAVHPAHRAALAAAGDDATRITRLFTGKPARTLRNRLTEELLEAEDEALPYPLQLSLTGPLRRDAATAETLPLWSGQAAGLTREMPAGELVRRLGEEAATALRRLAG
ncbi:NAD(P)H-dependent flavin oxidoreductase [Marinimicrococcus flavescens]|uniref:Nitronate monooxygenase n=1 Tax=Marinimicrococcus flavescens TaxID=3031815 RepID=A0AAP3XT19_9PROT|nr:nitronate monooxygenase family protein [Marinimicrococcus flavescens]